MWKRIVLAAALGALGSFTGCHSHSRVTFDGGPTGPYLPYALEIEHPADICGEQGPSLDLLDAPPPATVRAVEQLEQWPLTLEEAIQLALENSEVIRDLGGLVVQSPQATGTVYDPALQETNPFNGPEAALSAFDAQVAGSVFFNRTERKFNNFFFAGGVANRALRSNIGSASLEVNKTAQTGTQFALRHLIDYNRNNAGVRPFGPNVFHGAYDVVLQGEFRHPLTSGLDFTRIAGPNATPGNYNGILLARINTDISLADFEGRVRDLLLAVEQTYWELYFAYRDLDALITGRDSALEVWKQVNERFRGGVVNKDEEALARAQYLLAQAATETSVSGLANGTQGVYAVERQLRRLLGLAPTDRKLIVPVSRPTMVDVNFDWTESLAQSLIRRVELRRQNWVIKQRELELIAARKFLLPNIDFIGQYEWRGFGDKLFGTGKSTLVNPAPPPATVNIDGSAYADLLRGDISGWRFGFEVTSPIGNRIGHLGVRNAELLLRRERALYREQERPIVSELRAAFVELDRAQTVSRTNYNRYRATLDQLGPVLERYKAGEDRLDFVLDAQRRVVDAESAFHRATVDYNLALANLQFVRGTLLDHLGVYLTEGPWSAEAHASAAKISRRFRYKRLNYAMQDSYLISRGAYPQRTESAQGEEIPAPDRPGENAASPLPTPAPQAGAPAGRE